MSEQDDSYRPRKIYDLGEGMAVIEESMLEWYKPRYLLDHNTKRAYKFIDDSQHLLTITEDDVDWESLKGLPEKAISCARELSLEFPSFISYFKKGVAQVRWQLVPDGQYYMDEDGYGMTADNEINIYGFIDQCGRAAGKFRRVENDKELTAMKRQAQAIVKSRKKGEKS